MEPATGLGALGFTMNLEVTKAKDFIQKQEDNRKTMAQVDWIGRCLDKLSPSGVPGKRLPQMTKEKDQH